MLSAASFSRSWEYYFCSSFTPGWISCIFRLALICFTKDGIRAARMTTVSPMIDSAQDAPESSGRNSENSWCHAERITEVIQYSGAMMVLPMEMKKSNTQAPCGRVEDGLEGAGTGSYPPSA